MSRPVVSVYSGNDAKVTGQVTLPAVFQSPIRLDIVQHVYRDMSKNSRQAYAVSRFAGHQCSAASWGTGRAVSRIPRVHGSGTHRAGEGAFGNMCRGGRMFNPTKTWRKWHRHVNKKQRRYAVCAALAASAVVPLVMARGHRVENLPEIPLVIRDDTIRDLDKTRAAVALLQKVGAYDDVEKSKASRGLRAGKGKMRNRRYTQRRGPLVIYDQDCPAVKAFRNIPGVELCAVSRLNLLQLAPGGHLGRFCIWTQSAFESLDKVFGTHKNFSTQKSGWKIPSAKLTNADITRIINSDEVQSALRPAQGKSQRPAIRKKNPLKNFGVMVKLNPYAKQARRQAILNSNKAGKKGRTQAARRSVRKRRSAFHASLKQ